MDSIRRENFTMYNISTKEPGFYYESIIVNRTRNPILAIDHNNKRVVIQPAEDMIDGTIVAIVRSSNGPRRAMSKKSHEVRDLEVDTTRIVIPAWLVEAGQVFVKELDVILANPDCGHSIRHHNAQDMTHAALVQAIQGLVNEEDGVFVHFLINDPKGRTDKVFGAFGPTNMFVMDTLSVQTGMEDTATLTIVVGSHNRTHIQSVVDIENLYVEGSLCLEGQNVPLAIGLTADDAVRAAGKKLKETERQVMDQVSKRMSSERDEHKEQLAQIKAEIVVDVNDTKGKHIAEIATLKKTISDLEGEVKASSEWKALYLAKADVAKQDSEVHTYHTKRHEAEERTNKAKLATANETTKLLHTVAKIAGGVIIGVIAPWILSQMSSGGE